MDVRVFRVGGAGKKLEGERGGPLGRLKAGMGRLEATGEVE